MSSEKPHFEGEHKPEAAESVGELHLETAEETAARVAAMQEQGEQQRAQDQAEAAAVHERLQERAAAQASADHIDAAPSAANDRMVLLAKETMQSMRKSEERLSKRAFDYVRLPDYRSADHLAVGEDDWFNEALTNRKDVNTKRRTVLGVTGGLSAAATGISGIGLSAAGFISAAAGTTLLTVAMPAVLGGTAALFGGKYLYDKYRERKAKRDYAQASVARKDWTLIGRSFNMPSIEEPAVA